MAPVCAVVVAGGSGQRFGNPGGKQLVNVAGRPLMSWSIRAFDRSDKVGHIVVVCPAERRAEMRRLAIDPFDYDTPISFADAGDTRQDSTRAGVHAAPAGFEYVAIHDGARPLITTEAIDDAIVVLMGDRSLDGVVCGQPAFDTLKIVDMMAAGQMTGLFCQGLNLMMAAPDKTKVQAGLSKLKWLVVIDPLETETARFWENHGEFNDVDPSKIQTEVIQLPSTCFAASSAGSAGGAASRHVTRDGSIPALRA